MANRVLVLRSSVPGARPSGRVPGELFVNWPDRQFGVIDAAGQPMDLIAVRHFSTDASYVTSELVATDGKIYRAKSDIVPGPWDPDQWEALGGSSGLTQAEADALYLGLDGGTLNGDLVIQGNNPVMMFDKVQQAGDAGFSFHHMTKARWMVTIKQTEDDALGFRAYDDTGRFVNIPLLLKRNGTVTLALDPGGDMDATTKRYVDAPIARIDREIGQPAVVVAHTDLVTYIAGIDTRLSAIEHSGETPVAARHVTVDKYGGSFIRLMNPPDTGTMDVALATVPGPGGEVYPSFGVIPGTGAVWADYGGSLGHVKTAAGADVLGSTLKEWIRRQSILTVHKDNADPAHPVLVVDLVTDPTPPGSSLSLGNLKTVADAADTAPAGNILAATGVGQWGPIDPATLAPIAALQAALDALTARVAALETAP